MEQREPNPKAHNLFFSRSPPEKWTTRVMRTALQSTDSDWLESPTKGARCLPISEICLPMSMICY